MKLLSVLFISTAFAAISIKSLPTTVKIKPVPTPGTSAIALLAQSMGAKEWKELVSPSIQETLGNVTGSSQNIASYSDTMVWDPIGEQAFFVGADHLAPQGPQFVSYTASDNTWRRMTRPDWLAGATFYHGYQHTSIDPIRQVLFVRPYGSSTVKKYNIATKVWTDTPSVYPCQTCFDSLEYFPELDGIMWIRNTGEIYLYKESTQKWNLFKTVSNFNGGTWTVGEYDPIKHVMFFLTIKIYFQLMRMV